MKQDKENKTVRIRSEGGVLSEFIESVVYIYRGILYYYYLLIDFLFGNISNIVMYNLLKVTIVLLTIVSFNETFSGLRNNFFSTWTAVLVTLGVQGTLMALSLYAPIQHAQTNLKGNKSKIIDYIKKYMIWVPLLCCLTVSSFFSYVSISEKMYSKTEHINNDFKLKNILSNTFMKIDNETFEQMNIVENNIDTMTKFIRSNIVDYMESNGMSLGEINLDEDINKLKDYLRSNKDKYERSVMNYGKYQDAVATTVDLEKRKINEEKAERELEYIEEYENKKTELGILESTITDTSIVTADISQIILEGVLVKLDEIDSYNLFDIELNSEDINLEVMEMGKKLDSLKILNVRTKYLSELLKYKEELQDYSANIELVKKDILETGDLDKLKKVIFESPFNMHIYSPNYIDNKDIVPMDTFSLLEEVYNFERLTNDGTNQIEKAVGYLTNNSFPLLAYISIFMAFFIDGLVLIQGFSVTKKISNAGDMSDFERQDFIFWILRRDYVEIDKETGKIRRIKVLDKFLSYCVPNENCTKIYLNIDEARKNSEMSMIINILSKLNYLISNEDDRLTLDADLMVIYFQRTATMVDTDYFYRRGK